MFCIHCGQQTQDDARFCPKCGKAIEKEITENNDVNSTKPSNGTLLKWFATNKKLIILSVIVIFVVSVSGVLWQTQRRNAEIQQVALQKEKLRKEKLFSLVDGKIGILNTGLSLGELERIIKEEYGGRVVVANEHIGEGMRGDIANVYLDSKDDNKPSLKGALDNSGKIAHFTVFAPEFKTKEGIGVGSNWTEIKRAYPQAKLVFGEGPVLYIPEIRASCRVVSPSGVSLVNVISRKEEPPADMVITRIWFWPPMKTTSNPPLSNSQDTNTKPADWLNQNMTLLQNIEENNMRLVQSEHHYEYLLVTKDTRFYDKVINNAKALQKQISNKNFNNETEDIRETVFTHLHWQIEIAQYAKYCISSNLPVGDYKERLKTYPQGFQGYLANPQSILGNKLRKYNINTEDLFKKAYNATKGELW